MPEAELVLRGNLQIGTIEHDSRILEPSESLLYAHATAQSQSREQVDKWDVCCESTCR
jgi:hypothetical protein